MHVPGASSTPLSPLRLQALSHLTRFPDIFPSGTATPFPGRRLHSLRTAGRRCADQQPSASLSPALGARLTFLKVAAEVGLTSSRVISRPLWLLARSPLPPGACARTPQSMVFD